MTLTVLNVLRRNAIQTFEGKKGKATVKLNNNRRELFGIGTGANYTLTYLLTYSMEQSPS